MNAKQLWMDDVRWAGKPVTSNRSNSASFDFFKNGQLEHIWYIHSGNILCRLPLDIDEREYNWELTSKQVTAFYRDWNRMNKR